MKLKSYQIPSGAELQAIFDSLEKPTWHPPKRADVVEFVLKGDLPTPGESWLPASCVSGGQPPIAHVLLLRRPELLDLPSCYRSDPEAFRMATNWRFIGPKCDPRGWTVKLDVFVTAPVETAFTVLFMLDQPDQRSFLTHANTDLGLGLVFTSLESDFVPAPGDFLPVPYERSFRDQLNEDQCNASVPMPASRRVFGPLPDDDNPFAEHNLRRSR